MCGCAATDLLYDAAVSMMLDRCASDRDALCCDDLPLTEADFDAAIRLVADRLHDDGD